MKQTINGTKTLDEFFSESDFHGNLVDSRAQAGKAGDNSRLSIFNYAYGSDLKAEEAPFVGTKSLFNEYAIFRYEAAAGDHNLLYDREGEAGITGFATRNPSVSNIVNWSLDNTGDFVPFGAAPYSYSDFLYCKYHGMIPNNYLVTLRRFPFPMVDNLKTSDGRKIPPIAQAVTWFGAETGNSLKDIFKFAFGQNWKEIEASVQEVVGNEQGFDASPFAALPGGEALRSTLSFLNPREYSGQDQKNSEYAQQIYGADGPYANKVYGPVNVVTKTFARERGLHFEHEISLNFQYELKSIGNINPKAAMLDLISNMLTLTYNNAKFWGGAIRYFPQYPRTRFFGDQSKFYGGDMGGYIDSVMKEFSTLGTTFMKAFKNLLSDPIAALKELASGGGNMMMGNIAARSRPQILAMRSLLTGEPVGEWHIVIGNPMNPIAMIGNLICTDCEFEFSDDLGADDFPGELKVSVKLKHGKPRDKGDIESMFNLGNGRMYYGIKDAIFPSANNSQVDTSGQKGNNNAGKISDKSQNTAQTPAEVASLSNRAGEKQNFPSMWGTKFKGYELGITKNWAGSANPDPAPKKNS